MRKAQGVAAKYHRAAFDDEYADLFSVVAELSDKGHSLQAIADNADKLKRNRGRRGLDILNRLRGNEKIDVVIRYVQDLTYDSGKYEFVFPMVVGPRFIPGTPVQDAMSGKGTYFDTSRVPDASRITPPA